ncbi:MAG TPA: PLP-dependent aspartate aminotransferase family protein [Ignavibacteriales bacterium]|nr:PLP-dependent aspartate aminotransferase family protein [Ignavibacteriales bacterium]
MSNNFKNFDTLCIHAGIEDYEFGPVVPPIYQTSTFRFDNAEQGANIFAGKIKGYNYTRLNNPTIEAMENSIASLEGGYKALGCASGMAAIHTVFASLLKTGDHVVASHSLYGPTITLLDTIFAKFNIESTFINTSDLNIVENSLKRKNTKLVYIETPGNPTLDISDIEELAKLAHQYGALLVVDNAFMSPALQKPLLLGADVVLHSMSKYINGHADVIAGIVVVKDQDMYTLMRKTLNQTGGVIDPFNSFLIHRGVKTLSVRMEKHNFNAQKVAEFLANHPLIEKVYFPGLPNHPNKNIHDKQAKGPGAVISCEIKGGLRTGVELMNNLNLFQLAVSLGGVESLIQHPASMTHASVPVEQRLKSGITDGLIRISVGIEDINDLLEDLNNGLEKAKLVL